VSADAQLQLPLTPRQVDVARLAARGLGTTEIADTLTISYPAAKSHVYAIADKLDNPLLWTPLRLVRQWAIANAPYLATLEGLAVDLE
jgi:ATP/maltotriose-dependent transcriptional regulator MalT